MTHTLPYLHKNSRSQQLSKADIREIYIEEITRGLNCELDGYLRKVMP